MNPVTKFRGYLLIFKGLFLITREDLLYYTVTIFFIYLCIFRVLKKTVNTINQVKQSDLKPNNQKEKTVLRDQLRF